MARAACQHQLPAHPESQTETQTLFVSGMLKRHNPGVRGHFSWDDNSTTETRHNKSSQLQNRRNKQSRCCTTPIVPIVPPQYSLPTCIWYIGLADSVSLFQLAKPMDNSSVTTQSLLSHYSVTTQSLLSCFTALGH